MDSLCTPPTAETKLKYKQREGQFMTPLEAGLAGTELGSASWYTVPR